MDSKKQILLDKLDKLISMKNPRILYLKRLQSANRQSDSSLPWPRLNIILGGAYEAEMILNEEVRTETAGKGCAMILPAFAYAKATLRFSYEFLSLVLRENFLRLVYHDFNAEVWNLWPPLVEYHLEDTLHISTVHAFNSCVHLGEAPVDADIRLQSYWLLLRLVRADLAMSKGAPQDKSYYSFLRVVRYIEEHYDQPLTRAQVSRELGLSESYFTKLFQRYSTQSMLEFQLNLRMRKAGQLLSESNLSVAEIAYACGFQSTSFFIRNFKARFSVTPARYRLLR